MVIGAMSRIFFSFNGAGPRAWPGGAVVKITTDCPLIPSTVLLAFAEKKIEIKPNSQRNKEFF